MSTPTFIRPSKANLKGFNKEYVEVILLAHRYGWGVEETGRGVSLHPPHVHVGTSDGKVLTLPRTMRANSNRVKGMESKIKRLGSMESKPVAETKAASLTVVPEPVSKTAATGRRGYGTLSGRILEVLVANAGEPVTTGALATSLGLDPQVVTKAAADHQRRSQDGNRRSPGWERVRKVGRGTYVYEAPEAVPVEVTGVSLAPAKEAPAPTRTEALSGGVDVVEQIRALVAPDLMAEVQSLRAALEAAEAREEALRTRLDEIQAGLDLLTGLGPRS